MVGNCVPSTPCFFCFFFILGGFGRALAALLLRFPPVSLLRGDARFPGRVVLCRCVAGCSLVPPRSVVGPCFALACLLPLPALCPSRLWLLPFRDPRFPGSFVVCVFVARLGSVASVWWFPGLVPFGAWLLPRLVHRIIECILHPILQQQLAAHLPHQGHRKAEPDLHGSPRLLPSMQVCRGLVDHLCHESHR